MTSFWERIAHYYNTNKVPVWTERRGSTCKSRWHKLGPDVSKFVGKYEEASRVKNSGEGEVDRLKLAHELFKNDGDHDFTFEHAWRELRNEPKWRSLYTSTKANNGEGSKRSRINEAGSYSTSGGSTPTSFPTPESAPTRPIGIKVAKGKGKRIVGSSSGREEVVAEVASLIETQVARDQERIARDEERIARRQTKSVITGEQRIISSEYLRANNVLMLNTLIAKDVLSPAEEKAKNRLMAMLFPDSP